jgi:hypothetical protein
MALTSNFAHVRPHLNNSFQRNFSTFGAKYQESERPNQKNENPKVGTFKLSDITPSRGGRIAIGAAFVVLATAESLTWWHVGPKIFGKKSDDDE